MASKGYKVNGHPTLARWCSAISRFSTSGLLTSCLTSSPESHMPLVQKEGVWAHEMLNASKLTQTVSAFCADGKTNLGQPSNWLNWLKRWGPDLKRRKECTPYMIACPHEPHQAHECNPNCEPLTHTYRHMRTHMHPCMHARMHTFTHKTQWLASEKKGKIISVV